jgi:hypothetical protein
MGCHRGAGERYHGIAGVGYAEDDLVVRVVEAEDRAERLVFVGVDAAERADDRDGWQLRVDRRWCCGSAEACRSDQHGEDVE